MSTEALISTLVGSAIGIAATWFFAWFYYKRAGDELQREAQYLQKLSTLTLRAMQNAGWAEFTTDEQGNITGLHFRLNAQVTSTATPSAEMKVIRAHKQVQPEEPAEPEL